MTYMASTAITGKQNIKPSHGDIGHAGQWLVHVRGKCGTHKVEYVESIQRTNRIAAYPGPNWDQNYCYETAFLIHIPNQSLLKSPHLNTTAI